MAGNAEYAIDIAANLTGDETLAELDALTSELTGAGKGAEFFQQAIQRVSRDLAAASAASSAAAAALATGNAEYRKLEAAADQAAKTVEKLGLKGDVMSRAYLEAAKASSDASGALASQASKLTGLEAAAKAASASEEKLSATMRGVTRLSAHVDKSISGQAESYEKLGSALGSVGGPLGTLGQGVVRPLQGFSKLSASIGAANAAAVIGVVGFAALAAAVVAVTAAVVVGAVKVAAWAVSLGDARRSAELTIDALQVMQPELVGLSGTISDVSEETGINATELNKLAGALLKAGKSADQMDDALRAAANAEVALGKGSSAAYMTLVQSATDAQKAVDEAAAKSGGAVDKKLTKKLDEANAAVSSFERKAVTGLGGVVARQMQGIDAQSAKLSSNLGGIFGDLNIDPVLQGLSVLVGLFDKNSVAGRALKFLFESIFQPLIDNAKDAATVVEAFYLGFLIGATKLYIMLKPAIKAVSEFFGFEDTSLLDLLGLAKGAGETLAYVVAGLAVLFGGALVVSLIAAAAVFGPLIAAVYVAIKAFGFLIDAGVAVYNYLSNVSFMQLASDILTGLFAVFSQAPGTILGFFMSAITGVVAYLTGINLASIGTNIMMGMVQGITAGIGAVVSAVKNAMSSAISAAKSILGIHSPSSVFSDDIMQDGVVAGAVQGAEDGADDVAGAYETMLAVPPANDVVPDPAEQLKQAQLSGDTAAIARLQSAPSVADADAPHAPGGGDAGGGGGGGPDLSGSTFIFQGLPDAKGAIDAFEEMLAAAIQGDAAKLGAAAARGKQAA
jgi:hypothetical protein